MDGSVGDLGCLLRLPIAIGISLLVTLLNGASRALVQHRRPQAQDFFLGIGLVLGASGTTLTNLPKATAWQSSARRFIRGACPRPSPRPAHYQPALSARG